MVQIRVNLFSHLGLKSSLGRKVSSHPTLWEIFYFTLNQQSSQSIIDFFISWLHHQHSKNVGKSFLQNSECFFFKKKYEFFKFRARKFHFSKYKKYFHADFYYYFLSSESFLLKYENNVRNFLSLGLQSSISRNIGNLFLEKCKKFFKYCG